MAAAASPSNIYNGFSVTYGQNEGMTYYDKAKLAALAAPFESPSQKAEFLFPLATWGGFCDQHRAERRATYKVSKFVTVADIRKDALFTTEVRRPDGKPVTLILTPWDNSEVEADATVNAANESLLGGGGCDERIHKGAGTALVKECAKLNGCEVGDAKITKGYHLPANYVIHTVGPLLDDDGTPDSEALKRCYLSCLKISELHKHKSIVFPCVGTGFYAFPMALSAEIVAKTVSDYVAKHGNSLETIIFSVPEKRKSDPYFKAFSEKFNKAAMAAGSTSAAGAAPAVQATVGAVAAVLTNLPQGLQKPPSMPSKVTGIIAPANGK